MNGLAALIEAIKNDDDLSASIHAVELIGGLLADVRRIADALETLQNIEVRRERGLNIK